jgi:hypothetical protein
MACRRGDPTAASLPARLAVKCSVVRVVKGALVMRGVLLEYLGRSAVTFAFALFFLVM